MGQQKWGHWRGAPDFWAHDRGKCFILYLCFCQLLAAGIGYGFYVSNLSWFKEHKSEEKITALQLVDAFVNSYCGAAHPAFGEQRAGAGDLPRRLHSPPSTRRMASDSIFNLQMVGFPGREIKNAPLDDAMAATIRSFAATAAPKPVSEVLTIKGEPVFRTAYPSLASQQSCVDCHNQLQAGKATWHLNDVMGAFVIDVPMGAFLRSNLIEAVGSAPASSS